MNMGANRLYWDGHGDDGMNVPPIVRSFVTSTHIRLVGHGQLVQMMPIMLRRDF
jgi:hypothetical protein